MNCAFTGHRDIAEGLNTALFERCLKNLIERGVDTFYNGMARGFDLFSACKIIELKGQYNLKLIACIPFGGQIDTMKGEDRGIYERVLESCDDINVLSPSYYPGCMYVRNRFMVDNAQIVFAHYHGRTGGTQYTLEYAQKCGKELLII